MIKYNALDPKLVLVQEHSWREPLWPHFAPAEGFLGAEFANAVESLAVELSGGNNKIDRMFAKKVQRVGLELVLDTVGEAGRTDEMKRHSPVQTDAQDSVKTGKVIHVSVRHEGMTDAHELTR
jgi:hypothetical protein